MTMDCKRCGAPLDATMEQCPYCGTPTPLDETAREEKLKRRLEAERKKKLAGLAQVKHVPGALTPLLYLCTLALWSPYWYATRMKQLDALSSHVKLSAWIVLIFALSWASCFCTGTIRAGIVEPLVDHGVLSWEPEIEGKTGSDGEPLTREKAIEQEIFEWLLGVSIVASAWLAFRTRTILQQHASRYLDKAVAVQVVAPSGTLLFLFGPMYLQSQINKMISMELLAPKI